MPAGPTVETTSAALFQKGAPGGVVVATHKTTAPATAIEAANRKVTLLDSDGKNTTVKCGPDVINFDQIRDGDRLKATMTEELAASMAAEGTSPTGGGAAVGALVPKGT